MSEKTKTGTSKSGLPVSKPAGYPTDRHLLEVLVCPLTRQPLTFMPERNELVSTAARLAYPVRDGIPIMLADEARELGDDE